MAKLCKSKKVVNSSVTPKAWYYGLEHCRKISYSGIPVGEEILALNVIKEDYTEALYYVHLTNGGADPAPAGRTKIATVDLSAVADVAAMYSEIETQMEAASEAGDYQVAVETDGVEVLNNFIGLVTDEVASAAEETRTVGQQSFGGALGVLTDEGASASFEFETLDQTGDATGNVPIESFLISAAATITMSLTDTSREKFEEIFIKTLGGTYENGADKIIGFGTGSFFTSLAVKMGKLIGHDAGVAYSDRSNDWSLLAKPNPSGLNFNKELQALECEFTSYFDATMPEAVNVFRIGDFSKIDFESL
jgi:hypothetical protein